MKKLYFLYACDDDRFNKPGTVTEEFLNDKEPKHPTVQARGGGAYISFELMADTDNPQLLRRGAVILLSLS
jgi:hypothetical protein